LRDSGGSLGRDNQQQSSNEDYYGAIMEQKNGIFGALDQS
jgi:hypothetical protein